MPRCNKRIIGHSREMGNTPLEKTVTKVTSLEVGPPAAAAFEIPAAYVERSPIAMEQEYKARFAKAYWGDKVSEVMERNYWKLR